MRKIVSVKNKRGDRKTIKSYLLLLPALLIGLVAAFFLTKYQKDNSSYAASCVDPVENTTRPWGGIVYTNWTSQISDINSVKAYVTIYNDPGANTPLYLQLYDFNIDGTGQYFGIQGTGLALFSRWNTTDLSNVRTGPGATAISSTSEGAFVSLRYVNFFGNSLPAGNYIVEVRRAEYDGVGDWFDYYITKENQPEQYIGGLRFPRLVANVPASFTDGGGSWIEDWRQESSIFNIPVWHVRVMPVFNGQWTPISAYSTYSPNMSNSDATFDGTFVHMKVGGSTPRCTPAGTLFSTRPPYPVFSGPSVTPQATPTPSAGNGLNAVYYNNQNLKGSSVTRTDPSVDFNWGTNPPVNNISAGTYSVRWTGYVVPKYSETFTFYTRTDDGVRLWVNGALLIDKWVNQLETEWSNTITLNAGQKYAIKMEYYQNIGQASAHLYWSSQSEAKQIIPQSQLFTFF